MSSESKTAVNALTLVLGATGNVGGNVVRSLLAGGHKNIRLLVRDIPKAQALFGNDSAVSYVVGDVFKEDEVRKALKDVERAFLVTQSAAPAAEIAFARLAKEAGIKLLVKLSVLGASSGAQQGTFPKWHGTTEDGIVALGVPAVFLQPTFFFQNYLGDAGSIKSQGAFYRPRLNTKVNMLDTRDIGDAAAAVLLTPDDQLHRHIGLAYTLPGPQPMTLDEAAAVLSEKIGKPVKYVAIEDGDFIKTLSGFGIPYPTVSAITKLYQRSRHDLIFGTVDGDFTYLTGKPFRTFADFVTENKNAFI